MPPSGSLQARFLEGDRRALARLITEVENGTEVGRAALRALYRRAGRARTIGITGPPGAGKSTLTNQFAKALRARGQTVGIIAVDPSSPYTQGAILGDRVRMQELSSDPEIFMRSLASRGALGGISAATLDVIAVLDAFGKDTILIETVGAGQDEVEIAGAAQTTVLVNTPGSGDDIQAMKAGIMEIADILAVNKADLPGADLLVSQLRALLSLLPDRAWTPPIVKLIATEEVGIDDLVTACDDHWEFLTSSGRLREQREERARHQILTLARSQLLAGLMDDEGGGGRLDHLIRAVADGELDPHTAAREWVGQEALA